MAELKNLTWRSNSKAWMTRAIFDDWLNNVFAPTVAAHLKKKRLPKRALLLLDNCSSHPQNDEHGNNLGLTDENNLWIQVSFSSFS